MSPWFPYCVYHQVLWLLVFIIKVRMPISNEFCCLIRVLELMQIESVCY
jgi:hypothetical protein